MYGTDHPEKELLARCYRNTLRRAEEHEIASIAFPAISTGAFGYPLEEATEVALRTVVDAVQGLKYVRLVRFVLFSSRELEAHENKLSELLDER